jgi:hypothetical protein
MGEHHWPNEIYRRGPGLGNRWILGHRLGDTGELFEEKPEHVVSPGGSQLALAGVATGDADTDCTCGVGAAMSPCVSGRAHDAGRSDASAEELPGAVARLSKVSVFIVMSTARRRWLFLARLDRPVEDDFQVLRDVFKFHPLAIEDSEAVQPAGQAR